MIKPNTKVILPKEIGYLYFTEEEYVTVCIKDRKLEIRAHGKVNGKDQVLYRQNIAISKLFGELEGNL